MKKIIITALLILFGFTNNLVIAQTNLPEAKVIEYIAKYRDLAIHEQIRVGIPAAITLAQGILESGAGTSDLSQEANNHFGLKCKNNWEGETMLHDDETKDECFRKYAADKESYADHSNYLRNNRRYSFLFDLPVNNYEEWAVGLRKAGYATNPKYSARLITLINKHNLQNYTLEATLAKNPKSAEAELGKYNAEEREATQLSKAEKKKLAREKEAQEQATEKKEKIKEEVKLARLNGLEGFYATKGSNLIYEADIRGLKPSKLIDYNELEDAIVPIDMFIYAERKLKKASVKKVHIVQEGEDMYLISQKEGMQLRSILALNKLGSGEEPVTGARIYLQEAVSRRPHIKSIDNNNTAMETKPMEIPAITDIVKEGKQNIIKETPVEEPKVVEAPIVEIKEVPTEIIPEPTAVEETAKENAISNQQIDPQALADNVQNMLNNTPTTDPIVVEKIEPKIEETVIPVTEVAVPIVVTEGMDEESLRKATEEAATQAAIDEAVKAAEEAIKASEEAAKIAEEAQVASRLAEETSRAAAANAVEVVTAPTIVVPAPKSPSTYNEPNVSADLHRLKRIMDDVVYAAPIVKAVVPKPAVAPKPLKPATPKATNIKTTSTPKATAIKTASKISTTDSIVRKGIVPKTSKSTKAVDVKTTTDKKAISKVVESVNAPKTTATKVTTKTIPSKNTNPIKNTIPIATDAKKPNTKVEVKKVETKKIEQKKVETKPTTKTTFTAKDATSKTTTIKIATKPAAKAVTKTTTKPTDKKETPKKISPKPKTTTKDN